MKKTLNSIVKLWSLVVVLHVFPAWAEKMDCVNTESAYDVYQGVGSNYGILVQKKEFGLGLTEKAKRILDFSGDATLTSLCNGNIVVVWLQDVWGKYPTYLTGRIYDNNFDPITDEFRITNSNNSQWEHSVAPLQDGGFIVTWKSHSNDDVKILGRVFNNKGKPVARPINISTSEGNNARATANGISGGFAVVWVSSSNVNLRIFNIKGVPISQEIPVVSTKLVGPIYPTYETAIAYITVSGDINIFLPGYAHTVAFARSFDSKGHPLTEILKGGEAEKLAGYQLAVEKTLRFEAIFIEYNLRQFLQKDVLGFTFCDAVHTLSATRWMNRISAQSKDPEMINFANKYGEAQSMCTSSK